MDTDSFCREVEAHLCRRNAGHLVRIVGPAFEMVAGWAAQGIPLKVALRGIDACVDRRAGKGPSRRPMRIEFCEADVLDGFDQWRRAVGVGTAGAGGATTASDEGIEPGAGDQKAKSGHSLRAHLDRVVTRLTDRVASGALGAALEPAAEAIIAELAGERAASRSLRGEARARFIERLREIDRDFIETALAATPVEVIAGLAKEAAQELIGFKARMAADDYDRAVAAATAKLVRDRWKLPDICYE